MSGSNERRDQPGVGQQRRIDAVRDVPQLVNRVIEFVTELPQHCASLGLAALAGEVGSEGEPNPQRC